MLYYDDKKQKLVIKLKQILNLRGKYLVPNN